jgi:hypothetical protein
MPYVYNGRKGTPGYVNIKSNSKCSVQVHRGKKREEKYRCERYQKFRKYINWS